jgi:hypothetical protein
MGYGLVNGFIDHLHTPIGTTSNYSAITNLHTLQITTVPAKPFPVCCFITSHLLATASTNGDSSGSCAQVLLSQLPMQNSLLTVNSTIAPSLLSLHSRAQLNFQHPIIFFITTLHRPSRKHHFQQ